MFLVYLIIAAIVVNLIVPAIAQPFATASQITPPTGAANLGFFDQLMHMFVHHAQVPISSSLIVAIIVVASHYLANYLNDYMKGDKMY